MRQTYANVRIITSILIPGTQDIVCNVQKIGMQDVHVSTVGESEMCYSLGTNVGDVTRLNVATLCDFRCIYS